MQVEGKEVGNPDKIKIERTLISRFFAIFRLIWAKILLKVRKNRGMSANGQLLYNVSNFWCPVHWKMILESQNDVRSAIDPNVAVMGVGRALDIKYDHELEGPLTNACEMLPREILEGILDRSRGWL